MVLDTLLLSAIVIAATQVLKLAFRIPKNWQPAVAVALAFIFGGTASFWDWEGITMGQALIAGFAAAGLWDFGKPPIASSISIVKSLISK